MSLALARKYRPKRFADVAVQSHVSTTLQGAIARGRVAHGYLLCGPRGVGKTTLARVLAMALNCDRRDRPDAGGEPCGECESCRRIWSGAASLDVVEIDAASNRGVDDARDLRERAMYAPSGDDRYKVYIVDEAHMLTREAWNALLKILEEPPPRVVFVFATTEPQKIAQAAAPVLSRLQRFDLKRIGASEIRARLTAVLQAEGVAADADAVAAVARAADGSMRDALSITDQVLSMGETGLTVIAVRDALGLISEDEYLALLDLIADRRAADVFPFIGRLADAGVDFATFLAGFSEIVRAQLAIALGGSAPDQSDHVRDALIERRQRIAAPDLVRMLAMLTELEPRFKRSGQQQLLIETTLVRFALLDRTLDLESLLRAAGSPDGGGGGGGTASRPATESPARAERAVSRPRAMEPASALPQASAASGQASARQTQVVADAPPAPIVSSSLAALDLNRLSERWDSLIERLRAANRTLVATALERATPHAVTAQGVVTLALDEPNEFYAKAIERASPEIVAALREWFSPVDRVVVGDRAGAPPPAPPKRLTNEMVRADTLETLKRKDPVLAAAIDALDLEVVE